MKPIAWIALVVTSTLAGAESHSAAGKAAYEKGDYRLAASEFDFALIEAQEFPPLDPRRAISLCNAALAAKAQAQYSRAETLLTQAIRLLDSIEPMQLSTIDAHEKLANLKRLQGRDSAAEGLYQAVIADLKSVEATNSRQYAVAMNNLGDLYASQGRYTAAEEHYRKSLEVTRIAFGDDEIQIGVRLQNLGQVAARTHRLAEAERLYRESIAITRRTRG
ncbi:MAG: tetratricopeptide repeat protein, partial [Bryobacteraceae bacterium]